VPVEGAPLVVRVRVDEAVPPAGTVTGLGRLTDTPVGAVPLQAADRLMVELKPSIDESVIVEDCAALGGRVITEVAGGMIEVIV